MKFDCRVHEVAQAAGETTKKDEKKQDEGKATKREIVVRIYVFIFIEKYG